MVKPCPAVRVFRRLAPGRVVLVKATETLVTPSAELALNESVAEGWNKREPSGEMLENVGWACAVASAASSDTDRIKAARGNVFIALSYCFIGWDLGLLI